MLHATEATAKKPLINCLTHVFIGEHVPHYLVNTFVPAPLHLLLPLPLIVKGFRLYYNRVYRLRFRSPVKAEKISLYRAKMTVNRNPVLKAVFFLIALVLTVQVFLLLFAWLSGLCHRMHEGKSV